MMLRSRTRYWNWILRNLPLALICSAGLGCAGRSFNGPLTLPGAADAAAGTASVDESQADEGFLAGLFGRGPNRSDWSQDPFLDAPAVAQLEPADSSIQPTQAAGRTRLSTPPQSDRPARATVSDAPGRSPLPEAAARRVAAGHPVHRNQAEYALPAWAADSPANAHQLAQRPQQRRTVSGERVPRATVTDSGDGEGRVRISRLGTDVRPETNVEANPGQTRRPGRTPSVESLLAAARAGAQRGTVPEASRTQAPVSDRERRATDSRIRQVAGRGPSQSRGVEERPQQTSPVSPPRQHESSRLVRTIEQHFAEALRSSPEALNPLPATAVGGVNWRMTMNGGASAVPQLDDESPWTDGQANSQRFPILHEWRGVRANRAVALAVPADAADDSLVDERTEIRQTILEEHPGEARLTYSESNTNSLSDGLTMVGQERTQPFRAGSGPATVAGSTTVPPPPPVAANSGLRVFPVPPAESEEAGPHLGWFAVLLIVTGLVVFLYRRRQVRRGS